VIKIQNSSTLVQVKNIRGMWWSVLRINMGGNVLLT